MNPHVIDDDSRKVKPFKFSDSFLAGFNSLITAYDRKIEDLNNVKSLIIGDAHHGVCNCSYKMRYIKPEDVSTFISNLERAMENELFKPHTSDCDLFAVESVKRFLQSNGCVPFDAATIMGNPGANIPKGATLADLTFAAENENFGLIVYSKYELDKRADNMREDIGKMQNMHFSAAMKSFVQKIPDIMNKKATFVMKDSLLAKALETYIEDFIIFALRLNLTTVLQMIAYAVPREAYKNEPDSAQSNEAANNADNWDEDNDFFKQESVDSSSVSPVFFVFTKGKTPIISKAISKATDSEYSHISVSFDSSLDNMFSFGGKSFRKESIHDKARKDLDIDVYGTFISKNGVESMKDMCADFISNIKKTKFDYPALVKKLFGSDKKDNSGYKHICTTFTNRLLGVAGASLSDKNIPSPEEMREGAIAKSDQVFQLYTGNSKDYNRKKAEDKLKSMGNDPNAKKFDEVVTECCTGFLKTNDYMITNKIPFNCNMRDIVLQDMHPQFKDTISALKFIMNDERSPIHQLVIQHYTEPIDDYEPGLILNMFFGCCGDHCDDNISNTLASMNTDVNWLDKITYGNMFLDGNYRRDGLGNHHTHPIMNSFETIYKMFGGCNNICDNSELANSIIRISRVMQAIVNRYQCDSISWEMCRDILAVFGEIFTRNMLRLYYNNNHYLVNSDQMRDTMVPGYMYAEQFVLEANNGFTSNNDQNKVKQVGKDIGNLAKNMINWIRDKLATFLPKYFETSLQKQCEWYNKNGQAKYDEIVNAANAGKYNLPSKNKFYRYNVTFDPAKIKADEIITSFRKGDKQKADITELKKALMDAFDKPELAAELAKKSGLDLTVAAKNALLFSQIGDVTPETNYQLKLKPDWETIKKDMDFLCAKDNDGKARGGKWAEDVKNLSNSLQKAVKDLQTEIASKKSENSTSTTTANSDVYKDSFIIKLNDGVVMEMENGKGGTDNGGSEESVTSEASKTGNNGDESKAQGQQSSENSPAKPSSRDEEILKAIQDVASSFYVTSLNTIVKELFTDVYNIFKAVIDDYETMKSGGSNNNNNNNNNEGGNKNEQQ